MRWNDIPRKRRKKLTDLFKTIRGESEHPERSLERIAAALENWRSPDRLVILICSICTVLVTIASLSFIYYFGNLEHKDNIGDLVCTAWIARGNQTLSQAMNGSNMISEKPKCYNATVYKDNKNSLYVCWSSLKGGAIEKDDVLDCFDKYKYEVRFLKDTGGELGSVIIDGNATCRVEKFSNSMFYIHSNDNSTEKSISESMNEYNDDTRVFLEVWKISR